MTPQYRGIFQVLKWIVILGCLAVAVQFSLQLLTQGGASEQRAELLAARAALLEELEATDPVRAGVVRAGMDQYDSVCRLCHHLSGHGGRFTPSLVGKNVELIDYMLRLYRDGHDVGPLTALMAPWAADLSDEEIANLSEYIATMR